MADNFWELPLSTLKGVGDKVQQKLHKLGLFTQGDLLFHCPYRYEDRSRLTPIQDIVPGQTALIQGHIIDIKQIPRPKKRVMIAIADKTETMRLTFFNFFPKQFKNWEKGLCVRCYGTVSFSRQGMSMVHPDYVIIDEADPPSLPEHLFPIYPTVAGLSVSALRKMIFNALDLLKTQGDEIDPFSGKLKQDNPLTLSAALEIIHRPKVGTDCEALLAGNHPAMERLIREELFAHYLSLQQLKGRSRESSAMPLSLPKEKEQAFMNALPFTLTPAQQKVLKEIQADMAKTTPMLRLVQGDVGSGKTIVAILSAYAAVNQGAQVAVMVPTEILAEQHYHAFQDLLAPLGIRVDLFTGKLKAKAKRSLSENLLLGLTSVVIGTHALFQETVQFKELALVIIDEQHRFGVHQRLSLQKKGEAGLAGLAAHQLIMTATPIPRTLAMSRYAHCDLSTIDSLPPNRQPITTVALPQSRRDEVIARIKERVDKGQQIYWVCTLIEESETLTCQAAQDTFLALQAALAPIRVGLVHGKMSSQEKETVMQDFYAGALQVLVATTVIEVGVNVPTATLMVIENPERLGLAQLHQLRGRVGRGTEPSFCVLLYGAPLSETAQARLAVIRESQDGFYIAEADLALRGAGEILGKKQTGAVSFKFADFARDADLIHGLPEWTKPLQSLPDPVKQRIIDRWCQTTEYAEA